MFHHFFFASHSIEALAQRLAQELDSNFFLFSPPLVVIPHPSMKEWLQLELCKQSQNKAVVGLEFVSWPSALQVLCGNLPIPSKLERYAALADQGSEAAEAFSRYIEGFSFLATEEAGLQKTVFDEVLQAHGWKTYDEALKGVETKNRTVILFGIDYLPPAIHPFFLRHNPLQVYKFSPCAMFWEDFCSTSHARSILRKWETKDVSEGSLETLGTYLRDVQPLLANWGMIGRKMAQDVEEETMYEWEGQETLLNFLKSDLLFFEKPFVSFSSDDLSIQCMKTGASRFQEVKWLQQEIIRLVSEGRQLADIRVYAPDISQYAPILAFTFDQIPFRITDIDVARQSSFYQAILQMFHCVNGRWDAKYLLELFARHSFARKRKWQPEDIERFREWIDLGQIRWGVNGLHKMEINSVEMSAPSGGSWESGWEEMLDSLVYFRPEQNNGLGWKESALLESFYETWSHLQKTLLSWRNEKTLSVWADEIEALVDWALEADEELEEDRSAELALHKFIESLRKTAGSFLTEEFSFSFLEPHFFSTPIEEKKSLLQAVRCTSLLPGMMVPARVIFLLGMDEESFPRPYAFRSLFQDFPAPSDFDRYTFLQAIFSAKERLIFSYGDSSKEDGKPVSPSLLIQELFGYLDSVVATPNGEKPSDRLILKAPLESPPVANSSLLSHSVKSAEIVDLSAISLQEMVKFFRHPIQYYLTEVLGLNKTEEPESVWQDFELSSLDRHLFLKGALEEEVHNVAMPLGMFGELAQRNLVFECEQHQQHLQDWGIDPTSIEKATLEGNLIGVAPFAVPGGVLHLGADDIGGFFRRWPELLAVLTATKTSKVFCLRTGRVREIANPERALELAIQFFAGHRDNLCCLHSEWVDAMLRKKVLPELDEIKDPVLRWAIQRSPELNLEQELATWQDAWQETFAELIVLFPTRGQHAEI